MPTASHCSPWRVIPLCLCVLKTPSFLKSARVRYETKRLLLLLLFLGSFTCTMVFGACKDPEAVSAGCDHKSNGAIEIKIKQPKQLLTSNHHPDKQKLTPGLIPNKQ